MKNKIKLFIHHQIEAGFFHGAEVYIEAKGQVLCHEAYGKASVKPEEIVLKPNQTYDLASVTKVFTSTLLLKLVEEGKCSLEDRLSKYIEGFSGVSQQITLRDLLTHTSGLPAWYPFYAKKNKKGHLIEDLLDILEPLTIIHREKVEYSDLNFMLLGKVIETLTNQRLDRAMETGLMKPRGMKGLQYNPDHKHKLNILPTEWGNQIEQKMVRDRELYFDQWRDEVIWGQVNDGNAYYYMKGISGHAGLFGTVEDVASLARIYLQDEYLTKETIKEATSNQTSDGQEGRGLGWVVDKSLRGFGHTGFTGTALWVVPEEELMIILLTSRLHQEQPKNIQPVRKELYQLVLQEYNSKKF